MEKRGRPNEYRDSLNRVLAVTFKTETLGPCKILAHIPLKKATSAARTCIHGDRSKIRSPFFSSNLPSSPKLLTTIPPMLTRSRLSIYIYIYPLTGTVMGRAYLVIHYRHILTINAVPDDAHMRVINTPNTHADYPPFILLVVRSLRTPVSPNTYLM